MTTDTASFGRWMKNIPLKKNKTVYEFDGSIKYNRTTQFAVVNIDSRRFPGYAVILMDVAINNAGNKIFLLAQSYMPAHDIQVLNNPSNENLSPWYEVNDETIIETPEFILQRMNKKDGRREVQIYNSRFLISNSLTN